jgi:hypothetical protein
MWDIRRNISPEPLPRRRVNVQFEFPERPPPQRNYWLIVEPGEAPDLCKADPGFEVDLHVSTDLRTMTEIWLGYTSLNDARDEGRLVLTGARALQADLRAWLKLSVFATIEKRAR